MIVNYKSDIYNCDTDIILGRYWLFAWEEYILKVEFQTMNIVFFGIIGYAQANIAWLKGQKVS